MRNLYIYLSALSVLYPNPSLAIKHGATQLRDLLAYPKYEVQFLNHLPVSVSDAELAKSLGVEREEEWLDLHLSSLAERKRLSDGSRGSEDAPTEDLLELIPMSLVPPGSTMSADYLCLMPSKNSTDAQTIIAEVDDHTELDPVQSWLALSHLDGKCLYSKQGWFTYSYCHNSHIRQFREARHNHPHPPGGHEPEEDTSYDAYTLGRAAQTPSTRRRAALTVQKQIDQKTSNTPNSAPNPPYNSVSFGVGASSRYLVQRWSDGTMCDKTNVPREVEVQVHCSMTTNDVIYLVKEMAICQYVVIIHSPHLCGLAGFKAPQADVEPAGIRCRQMIEDEDFEKWYHGDRTEKERQQTLRLPWSNHRQTSALTGAPGLLADSELGAGAGEGEGDSDLDGDYTDNDGSDDEFSIEGLTVQGDEFFAMLNKALEGHRSKSGGGKDAQADEKEEVVVLALDEDEEGNIILDTDLVGGDGTISNLNGRDREMLLEVVKQFLESKGGGKGGSVGEEGDDENDGQSEDEKSIPAGGRRRDEL